MTGSEVKNWCRLLECMTAAQLLGAIAQEHEAKQWHRWRLAKVEAKSRGLEVPGEISKARREAQAA